MIKQIDLSELEILIDLKMKMFEEVGLLPFLLENPRQAIREVYSDLYKKGWAAHFVLEEGGRAVACAGGLLKNDIPACFLKTPYYGFVADVYTEPEFRGKGYATCLTTATLEWLKTKGVKTVKLLPSPEAKRIYQKIGFRSSEEMVLRL